MKKQVTILLAFACALVPATAAVATAVAQDEPQPVDTTTTTTTQPDAPEAEVDRAVRPACEIQEHVPGTVGAELGELVEVRDPDVARGTGQAHHLERRAQQLEEPLQLISYFHGHEPKGTMKRSPRRSERVESQPCKVFERKGM